MQYISRVMLIYEIHKLLMLGLEHFQISVITRCPKKMWFRLFSIRKEACPLIYRTWNYSSVLDYKWCKRAVHLQIVFFVFVYQTVWPHHLRSWLQPASGVCWSCTMLSHSRHHPQCWEVKTQYWDRFYTCCIHVFCRLTTRDDWKASNLDKLQYFSVVVTMQ